MASVEAIGVTHGATSKPTLLTSYEFSVRKLKTPSDLIKGRLIPAQPLVDRDAISVCRSVVSVLNVHAEGRGVQVFDRNIGVLTHENPDTVRFPAASVGSRQRLIGRVLRRSPVLTVDVLSSSNSWTEVLGRTSDFFAAGVREACVFDPESREAEVFRPDGPVRRVLADGLFETAELPGFSTALADCFEDLDDAPAPAEDA